VRKNTGFGPGFIYYLVAAPEERSEKHNHARNGQEAADKVDLLKDLAAREAVGIRARRREVEECSHD
jgi:hypothetical protein